MDVDSGSAAFHADDDLHLHLPVQMPAGKAPVESQVQGKAVPPTAGEGEAGRDEASKSMDEKQYRLPLTLPLHRKRRRATSDTTTNSSSQSSTTSTTNSSGSTTAGSGGCTAMPSTATGSMVTCSSSQTPATRQQRRKSMIQPSNNSLQKKPINAQATNQAGAAQSNSVAPNRTNENNDDDKGGPVRDKCMRCSMSAKKTPMMRKGPDGCRSLCNACGLKWSRHGIY